MSEKTETEKPVAGDSDSTPIAESLLPVRPGAERQETGLLNDIPITPATETPPSRKNVRFEESEDAPPPMPPRPISPDIQNLATLIEAFPDIDPKVIKAVLNASGGQVEPAFNALLGMSDPSFETEAPPPKPPRPTSQQRQLEADEAYARKLAQKYQRSDSRRAQAQQQRPQEEEREYSFFDEWTDFTSNELPEIRKNLQQGFQQTQSTVNKWISNFKKQINPEENDEIVSGQGTGGQRQNFGPSQRDQLRGISRNAQAMRDRRSMDNDRYDADAPALSGNFGDLELRDDDDIPPRKPYRPLANPNLFKPTPPPPQSGPVDEVDAALYEESGSSSFARSSPAANRQLSTSPGNGAGSTGRSKKWQPLTSLNPSPDAEGGDDDDPFSLGDSDDELALATKESKGEDINKEATERLKRAASMKEEDESGEGSSSGGRTLSQAETSGSGGTRDKVAEELLKS